MTRVACAVGRVVSDGDTDGSTIDPVVSRSHAGAREPQGAHAMTRIAQHGWLAAIAVAYLYLFPWFPQIHSANELPRAYLVQAIVEDHTFAIDRGVAAWGGTADVSPSGGHLYANKAPG